MTDGFEQDFVELVKMTDDLQCRVTMLEKSNKLLMKSNRQLIQWIEELVKENEDYKNNAVFELNAENLMDEGYWYPDIRSGEEAINQIVNERKSLARFGDGEFSIIAGRVRHSFQTIIDPILQERLREVLTSNEEDLIVGLADNYGSLEKYNEQTRREIRRYMNRTVRREHLCLLDRQKVYYDAYLSRPYVMYADNKTDEPGKRFQNLRRMWEHRDCVFVEGRYTRLGVGNDLFDNCASIKRIIGPAENSFLNYEEILRACLELDKDCLFLLAMGSTATILAYDLCRAGYQALDIGHLDLEYEWFLRGMGQRTKVDGKYNNEFENGKTPDPIEDAEYLQQIVADCS